MQLAVCQQLNLLLIDFLKTTQTTPKKYFYLENNKNTYKSRIILIILKCLVYLQNQKSIK